MKKLNLCLTLFAYAQIAIAQNQNPILNAHDQDETLPFSIQATEDKIDRMPDYMSANNPSFGMDFPYWPEKNAVFDILINNCINFNVMAW